MNMSNEWMHEGACASGRYDPDTWFPEWGDVQQARNAKKICGDCPVMRECRDYAVNFPVMLLGVWGGLTRREIRDARMLSGRSTGTGCDD